MAPRRSSRTSTQKQTESEANRVATFTGDSALPCKRSRSLVEVVIPSKTARFTNDYAIDGKSRDYDKDIKDIKQENHDEDVMMTHDDKDEIDSLLDTKPYIDGDDNVAPESRFNTKEQVLSAQPFNIGKWSSVTKSSIADLQDSSVSSCSRKISRGKRRAQYAGSNDEITNESEYEETEDYAMDSDEEALQLSKTIKLSLSRRDSDQRPRKKTNRLARKATIANAAQNILGQSSNATPIGTGTVTPLPDDDTVPSNSEFEKSESTAEENSFTESEEDIPLARNQASARARGGAKDISRAKSSNARSKTKKFQGKGRKLDAGSDADEISGSESISESTTDLSDPDMPHYQKLAAKKRKERRKQAKVAAPRKEKERELQKKLGRKLTNGEKNLIAITMHHPNLYDIWGNLEANITPVQPVAMEAHPSLKLTLLPFQKESLYWMKKQEQGLWKGGVLADEMGMGKTIQTIALLLSEPRSKPSLVVAPVVALMQWKNEIETHAEGFTVCLWHGQSRVKVNDLKKFDVVLVSYGTLEASFRRQQRGFKRGDKFIKEKSPMHEFEWFRVILDEAHNIKERSTNAAKAAFALKAQYRWCLSGTPLQNRVGELYSLVRFLGADPFSHYFCKKCPCKNLHWQFSDKRQCDSCRHTPMDHCCFWNSEILTPIAKYGIESTGPGHTAFKKLKILLDRIMLRRTKLERADDLGLPPRTIVVRRDYFSPAEKELYASLFTNAKRTFATYVDQGTVLNNYSNIFSLITRMRQMACHPDLVLRSKNSTTFKVQEGTVCRLCNDTAEDAIMSQCKHVFDRECIKQYLQIKQLKGHTPECPVCHIEISIDLEAEALDLEENTKARQGILSRLNLSHWKSSSKLEALVEELEKLRTKDCTVKSLVFSQFVSFLDLIAFRLQRAGFNICRLEGSMTPQQRDATIQHFMKNTGVTVFLISLKAGGVALNLTEASMVFMMDSWWNPSVEYQAMDRIHRLGQKRPVKVVKIVIEDSIEDQIVQLQAKKLAMTEAALSNDAESALGKLTVEDLGFLFKL
ncbi:hypothetical protein L204_101287 [Cryptococcus depauperatus]